MPGGSASEAPPEPKHGCDGNHGVQLFPLSNLFFFPYLVMDVDLSKIPNYSKIRAKDWKQRSRQVYPIDTIFELEDDRYVI